MTRRSGGGGFWGGSEPDLTRRPGSEGPTLKRIAGFFRPYRARLAFIAVLILITVGIGVVNPILLGLAIDNIAPGGQHDLGLLFLQCGLMIVLPIITSALGVWQSYLSNVVGQRVMNDLRLALYRHLQWMPLRVFTEDRHRAQVLWVAPDEREQLLLKIPRRRVIAARSLDANELLDVRHLLERV